MQLNSCMTKPHDDKVCQILQRLSQGHLSKDDTLLDKFESYLLSTLGSPDDVLEFHRSTSLNTILHTALGQQDLPAQVVGFFLRMPSQLAKHCFAQMELEDCMLTRMFQKAATNETHWANASVKHAWLTGLAVLADSPHGLNWLVKNGYETTAKECLSDNSLFVRKAAQNAIARIIIGQFESTHGEGFSIPLLSDMLHSLSEYPNNENYKRKSPDGALMTVGGAHRCESGEDEGGGKCVQSRSCCVDAAEAVEVLLQLCRPREMVVALCRDHHLPRLLTSLLKRSSSVLLPDMIKVLEACSSELVEAEWLSLGRLPGDMLAEGSVKTAMQLAHGMLKLRKKQMDLADLNQALEIRSLPLLIFCGVDLAHVDATRCHDALQGVAESLQTSQAAGLLLASLGHLRETTHQKGEGLVLVAKLLQLLLPSSDQQQQPSSGRLPGGQMMAKNTRVLHETLSTACHLLQAMESEESLGQVQVDLCTHIAECCLAGLLNTKSTHMVRSSALRCVYLCLEVCTSRTPAAAGHAPVTANPATSTALDAILVPLATCLTRSLCDVRWEARDEALEFLQMICPLCRVDAVREWYVCKGLPSLVLQSTADGESYVRATALTVLAAMAKCSQLWDSCTADIAQDSVVSEAIRILQTDPEAFARRAAVNTIATLHDLDLLGARSREVQQVMESSIGDFDWEVKVNVLDYWSNVCCRSLKVETAPKKTLPSYAVALQPAGGIKDRCGTAQQRDVVAHLVNSNCLPVLFKAVCDYDKPVQLKACRILNKLVDDYKEAFISAEPVDCKKAKTDTIAQQTSAETHCSPGLQYPPVLQGVTITDANLESILMDLDLAPFQETALLSSDQHAANPESLLDDLLTEVGDKECEMDGDAKENDDFIVDCY